MTPELIALVMGGLLLLGLFMGHPLAFVLGSTAVIGALAHETQPHDLGDYAARQRRQVDRAGRIRRGGGGTLRDAR